MPLQKEILDVPLAVGIDTKTDPKQTKRLLRLKNGVVDQSGAAQKLPGRKNIGNLVDDANRAAGGRIAEVFSLHEYKGSAVAIARDINQVGGASVSFPHRVNGQVGPGAFQYDEQRGSWSVLGNASARLNVASLPLVHANVRDTSPELVEIGNYWVLAYIDQVTSGNIGYFNVYTKEGKLLHSTSFDGDVARGGIVNEGTSERVLMFVYDQANEEIDTVSWNPETPNTAPTVATGVVTGLAAEGFMFAGTISGDWPSGSAFSGNREVGVVAYVDSASSDMIISFRDGDGTELGSVTLDDATYGTFDTERGCEIFSFSWFSTGGTGNLAVGSLTTRIMVFYVVGATMRSVVLTETPGVSAGPTLVGTKHETFVGIGSQRHKKEFNQSRDITETASDVMVFAEDLTGNIATDSHEDSAITIYMFTNAGALIAGLTEAVVRHARIAGRPFIHDGYVYLPIAYHSLDGAASTSNTLDQVTTFLLRVRFPTADSADTQAQLEAVIFPRESDCSVHRHLNGTFAGLYCRANVNGNKVSYALNRVGINVGEAARSVDITVVTLDMDPPPQRGALASDSLLLSGGQVSFIDGSLQESGFHLWPVVISVSGGIIATEARSWRATYEWIDRNGKLHRSEMSRAVTHTNTPSGSLAVEVQTLRASEILNKVGAVRISVWRTENGGALYFLSAQAENNETLDTLSITDDTSDANLVNNRGLYTDSGELASIGAPATPSIAATKDRVFLVDGARPERLWYSKPIAANLAVEFSDLQTIEIGVGGPFTAVGALEESVYAFQSNAIYTITGAGPNALGQGAFVASLLLFGIGCEDPNSVLSTPEGLFFRSKRGIQLMGRQRMPEYVGAAVERELLKQQILDAAYDEKNRRAYFVTTNGTLLIYDFLHKLWSTEPAPVGGRRSIALIDNVLWEASRSGVVWRRDETEQFREPMALATSWISLRSLQNYQRVWRVFILGEFKNAFTLRVKEYVDYKETSVHTHDLKVKAGDSQVSFWSKRPRCTAMRFDIEDLDGKGDYALSSLGIEAGVTGRQSALPKRLRN